MLTGSRDHDKLVENIIEDTVSRCVSLVFEDCEHEGITVSDLLEGLTVLAQHIRIELCSCGTQWALIKALSNIPCVLNASVCEAEVGINDITVRQHLGGTDPVRRSIALVLVGQFCLRLDPSSHHITTQLNIVCKNLSSALRAFTEENNEYGLHSRKLNSNSDPGFESDPDMEKRRMLGRMTCIGTFGIVINHWMRLAPNIGLRDLGFVMWPSRVLLGITSTLDCNPSDGEVWCRRIAAFAMQKVLADGKLWCCISQDTQTEWLRSILESLDACKMDEICETFVLNMYNSDECFSLLLGFPNYMLALLHRLLELLRPFTSSSSCLGQSGSALLDLRWAALTLVSRFLCKSCFVHDSQTAEDFSKGVSKLWGGSCIDCERYSKLRDQVRLAVSVYAESCGIGDDAIRVFDD